MRRELELALPIDCYEYDTIFYREVYMFHYMLYLNKNTQPARDALKDRYQAGSNGGNAPAASGHEVNTKCVTLRFSTAYAS